MSARPLLILTLSCFSALGAAAQSERPNIILVMSDDQGWGDVGYNGHPRLQTPHLDEMAAQGLRADNFFAGAPVCSPTRATCLTGRHHLRSGITWVDDENGVINAREATIADALAANGYRTGHFGKWHLKDPSWNSGHRPTELGFQYWVSTPNNADKVDPSTTYFYRGDRMTETLGEDSAILMDYALMFIGQSVEAETPFLAYIWIHTPHAPYGSTQEFLNLYSDISDSSTRNYYASITAMDVQIGRLRGELRNLGIADNTLVVFCSDNGPEGPGSTGPYSGRKRSISDGGLRVPGIIEWPAVITEPRVTQVPIVTSDLYPTFLAAAGVSSFGPPRPIDGENVLPEILGEPFTRAGPIRFMIGGQRGVCYPDGTFSNTTLDPGFAAWEAEVMDEFDLAWAAKMEIIANSPPRADAGDAVFALWSKSDPTASVTLNGSASSDADGTIVSYDWSWAGDSASGPSFTADFPAGRTEVTLTVTDDDGSVGEDTIGIHVLLENERTAPYEEQDGLVVIEAEAFATSERPDGAYPWRVTDVIPDSVGGLAIHVAEHGAGWYAATNPPVKVTYPVTVPSAGTYTLWSRRFAPTNSSDSVYLFVNDTRIGSESDNSGPWPRSWHWVPYGTFDLPAGESTLEIRYREDGIYIDRLVLAADPAYVPEGTGPLASTRVGIGTPDAVLQATPVEGEPPLLVEFDATGSMDADGEIVSYTFDFGDGSPALVQSTPLASHTYTTDGQYMAVLSVTDDTGLVGVDQAGIGVGNLQPVAVPAADETVGNAPLVVTFDGTGSYDEDGSIVSWQWDFDDDGLWDATGSAVSHTFDTAGTYPVALQVTDNEGGIGADTITIVVDPPLPAGTVTLEVVDSADLGNPVVVSQAFDLAAAQDSVFVVVTFTKNADITSMTFDPGGANLPMTRLVSSLASNPDLEVYLYAADLGDTVAGTRTFTINYSTATPSAYAAYQLAGTSIDLAVTTSAATVDTPLTVPGLPAGSTVIDFQIDGSSSSNGPAYGSPDSTIRFTASGNRGFTSGVYLDRVGEVTAGYNGNAAQGSVAAGFPGSTISVYEAWMNGYPELSGTDRDPDADPNHDGINNLFAFFHDIEPVGSGARGILLQDIVTDSPEAPGQVLYEFRKRAGAGSHIDGGGTVSGLPYEAEWSADLGGTWSTASWTHVETLTQPDGSEWVRIGLPRSLLDSGGRLFIRLRLE